MALITLNNLVLNHLTISLRGCLTQVSIGAVKGAMLQQPPATLFQERSALPEPKPGKLPEPAMARITPGAGRSASESGNQRYWHDCSSRNHSSYFRCFRGLTRNVDQVTTTTVATHQLITNHDCQSNDSSDARCNPHSLCAR
jgi:hypothetical protein